MTTRTATSFVDKLSGRIQETRSHLCVGVDPRPDRIDEPVSDFLKRVVEETAPYAAAFKPNSAFFEAMGSDGWKLLEQWIPGIPEDIPVILDVKRSDIAETQAAYARAYFEHLDVDAVTLNPLLGRDSIEPFVRYPGKGVYLLGITSNPGAQDILLRSLDGRPFIDTIQDICLWARGYPANTGLVIGLPQGSEQLFESIIDVPLLIPGLGAQGGDLSRLRMSGRKAPWLVNVSRAILYPENGRSMAEQAKQYAQDIRRAGELE